VPGQCSAACAPLFVDYYESCQGIIQALAADERAGFEVLSNAFRLVLSFSVAQESSKQFDSRC
jgi:hypothetical protein